MVVAQLFTSASVGGYVFLYSILFFSSKLELSGAVSLLCTLGIWGLFQLHFQS